MSKHVEFSPQEELMNGLDTVANAVKITIGPKGRNVVIEQGQTPIIANDGGMIAKYIQLKNPIENMGAQIIKDVIQKTSEKVGGGRTASAILTQAIVQEGIVALNKGMNMTFLKKGMHEAIKDITSGLKEIAKSVATPEEIKQIATISTESEELGILIADVINKVGKDCNVTYEDSQVIGVTSTIEDGVKFDKGWISPYMINSPERMEAEYKDIPVLITEKKISIYKELYPVIQKIVAQNRNSLVVICEDLDGEALNNSIIMKLKGGFNILAIKIPGFSDKKEWLEDIALITGGTIATSVNPKLEEVTLGEIKKIVSSKDSTLILGTQDTSEKVKELAILKENSKSAYDKEKLTNRMAILSGSVAVIKVGAPTDSELKYLKLKIEDGVNEAKRALEEGIVIGGNCAFIQVVKKLRKKDGIDDESIGYNIVLKAVEAPLRQIVENCGISPDVVIDRLLEGNFGFNALTNESNVDMFECGIIDAVKVTRTVLENAVSAAGIFLTIEVSIHEETDESTKPAIEY
jgi:chaperonin GroEL